MAIEVLASGQQRLGIPEVAEAAKRSQYIYAFGQVNNELFPRIGGKATNLVLLRMVGFPVPPGYCITTDAHQHYLDTGILPEGLIADLIEIKRKLGGKIAIRSSATCEDGAELSMAGVFRSHYIYHDEEINTAVEDIYRQSQSAEVAQSLATHNRSFPDIRMGLIAQELIEPEVAGVVYTGVNDGKTLVQYVDGFGVRLVDGQTTGSAVLIDKDGTITESTGFEARPLPQDAVRQLAEYSRAIVDRFLGLPQDIEFVYQGNTVHIVQARPLTTNLGNVDLQETAEDCLEDTKHQLRRLADKEKRQLGTQTAIFSDANYSELLPRPTPMDIGVHMYTWGGSDGIPGAKQLGHAEIGYLVGDEAIPIIHYIGGRTYSSIGRYAAVYHIGFPESKEDYFQTLVNEYLQAVQQDPQKGSYPQMGLFLQDPTLADLETRFGNRAEEYFQVYNSFASRMRTLAAEFIYQFQNIEFAETTDFTSTMKMVNLDGLTNEQLLAHGNAVLEHLRTKSHVNFVKAARLGFYYSQRLQDLLQQRLGMTKDEAQKMYSRLNQGLDGSLVTYANTQIAQASSEQEALELGRQLVGHFSTGEMLEVRHKPLRDDPEALLRYVRGIRQAGNYTEQFQRQKEARLQAQNSLLGSIPDQERTEFEEVMKSSQTYMALRETIKHLYTMDYLIFRDVLELLGRRVGLAEGDIYFLYPRELSSLVADPASVIHLIRSRRQSFENYSKLDLPHVIAEPDIDQLRLEVEDDKDFDEAKGKFLAEGVRISEGVVVNLDEFEDLSQAAGLISEYRVDNIPIILVATQMNLSHDPFIAQAAGLAIENAGIVAHGAQRARELGKGAIGGIKSKLLRTGMMVDFDPATRSIRKVE